MVSPGWLVNTSWLPLVPHGLFDDVHMHGATRIEQTNYKLKHGKLNGKKTKDYDVTKLGSDV